MLKRIGITAVISVIFHVFVWAQAAEEILNLSQRGSYGSARVMGLSGAMNAIGADATLIPTNPAALGAFWKSELNLGFTADNVEITSSLNGGPINSANTNIFRIGHLAYIKTTVKPQEDFLSQSFAFGFQKLADFDRQFIFDHVNTGSITEYWLARADGLAPDELNNFQEGLAYDAEALYDDGQFYFTDYLGFEDRPIRHYQISREEGYNNEFYMAYGANIRNQWMFGVSIGIPFFRYRYERDYVEEDVNEILPEFNELILLEDLETTGVGINIKLGAIFKLSEQVRFSAAVHSPTFYSLTDESGNSLLYSYTTDTNFSNNVEELVDITNEAFSPLNNFEYSATSAWRGHLGTAFLFEDKGFIDAEVEYVAYNNSRYNLTSQLNTVQNQANENFVNDDIQRRFRNAINFRVGGELALNRFRARAGVQLIGSPYEDNTDFNSGFSLGLGYRSNRFYIDGAYVTSQIDRNYRPYPVEGFNEQLVAQNFDRNQFVFTLGYKL